MHLVHNNSKRKHKSFNIRQRLRLLGVRLANGLSRPWRQWERIPRRCNWNSLEVAGIIRSPKRAKSERVVELVIGNMSGWILQDVGSVARPWEHPLFWGGGPPPPPGSLSLVPPTSASDDGGRGEAGIKLSFILAGTLTLCTVRKLVRPRYTFPYRSALLILGSAGFRRLILPALYFNVDNRVDLTKSKYQNRNLMNPETMGLYNSCD